LRTRRTGPPGGEGTDRRRNKAQSRTSPRRDQPSRRGRPVERLYGRNAVRESLRAWRRRFERLLIAEGVEGSERVGDIAELAQSKSVSVERTSRDHLNSLVTGHHQGVVLEAGEYPYASSPDLRQLSEQRATLLALDGLVDPQNVGTLLRTAEATGVALVVIPSDRSARITPAVVNASAGAVEHLQIAEEVNLSRWLDRAREAGFWAVGMAGDENAASLFDSGMTPPIVLVVGSEGSGLRRLVRERCDVIVKLPMGGQIESLNAAVAGSIGLYEILRDSATD
jgi:23S rRNA (guanosine2251-2'-O)-methyltransferase